MKTILVTGGAGFIGSHTCIDLIEQGLNVVVIDSFINSSEIAILKIKEIINLKTRNRKNQFIFFQGDIRDEEFLKNVFGKVIDNGLNIDAVIHFAGLKSLNESIREPLLYWEFNVLGSISLLKIMEEFNCHTLIFSSSASIYGIDDNYFINEESLIKPNNPYAKTKETVENLLNDIYKNKSDWRIANLRYFNPIGAHESGLIGQFASHKTHNIFPKINSVASGKKDYLEIFGVDYSTKDGTCIRDYIHVSDLSYGHIAALYYIQKTNSILLNLNLGTGVGTSVLELVNIYEKVNNCKIPIKFVNRREADKPVVVADNSKALEVLDWYPKKNIEDMCRDGWKWQKNFQT